MSINLSKLFDELSFEQKHFFCFCSLFFKNPSKIPDDFWQIKTDKHEFCEIFQKKEIFSALLLETAINYLKGSNTLIFSGAAQNNRRFTQNSTIFENEDEDTRSISPNILANLYEIYLLISGLKMKSLKGIPQENFTFNFTNKSSIPGYNELHFNNSESIYDLVLNHLVFQHTQRIFAKELKIRGNTSHELIFSIETLIRQLIADSPFSVFSLSNPRVQLIIFGEVAENICTQIINKILVNPSRIPFFYDYIVKNWMLFHRDVYQFENAPEIIRFLSRFADFLNEFTQQVKQQQNLFLLELVLNFYEKYFDEMKLSRWLKNIKTTMHKMHTKSAQAKFVSDLINTLNPLIQLIGYIEKFRSMSFYELNEAESSFRQIAHGKVNHLREQFEIFRAKLNRILAGK